MAEELEMGNFPSMNMHNTVYVVTPEFNMNNQMIFRDNLVGEIQGKNVLLLLATTTTGMTMRRSLECIEYYGGKVQGICSVFSAVKSINGLRVEAMLDVYKRQELMGCGGDKFNLALPAFFQGLQKQTCKKVGKKGQDKSVSYTHLVVMNPVRQRIIQYLILHEEGTAASFKEELNDIPTASLYRHITVLYEAGCIEVIRECRKRGTVEKTYALVKQPLGEGDRKSVEGLIQSALFSLMASFTGYFADEGNDFRKDMLSLTTSTLLLTDEEYMEMTGKIGAVFNEYIYNKPEEGRRPRRITFISSPCEEEQE